MALKPDPKRRNKSSKRAGPGAPMALENEVLQAGSWMWSRTTAQGGGVLFLPQDEIISRQGWKTYRDMMHDDQVKATMSFKQTLVGGRTWEIKPADDSEQAKEIAKFVQFNLERMNFKAAIRGAMSAFKFGFATAEIIWELGEYEGNRSILLKDLKHRDPETIEIIQDEHGNILRFQQRQALGVVDIDTGKSWHWAYQSEFGNAYGISDLRAAYRSWWAKKFVVNFWNVFMERMGAPMTLMHYPQGASTELKDTLKRILQGLSSKNEVLVPEGVEVKLVEAMRSGQGGYDKALEFHDLAIARALLMVGILGLSTGSEGQGADSQSRLQLRLLFKMADELAQDIVRSLEVQVLRQLVDMNFVHENLYPKFIWQDYGAFEGLEIADTIRQLHVSGVIDLDQADVNYIRSVIGLPLRSEENEDEVIRPEQLSPVPPVGGGGATPPAPEQGNDRAKKGAGGNRKTDVRTGKSKRG